MHVIRGQPADATAYPVQRAACAVRSGERRLSTMAMLLSWQGALAQKANYRAEYHVRHR